MEGCRDGVARFRGILGGREDEAAKEVWRREVGVPRFIDAANEREEVIEPRATEVIREALFVVGFAPDGAPRPADAGHRSRARREHWWNYLCGGRGLHFDSGWSVGGVTAHHAVTFNA